jgi:hypothetical protein
MARIRRPDPAWRLLAIKRQSKGAKILAPKCSIEFLAQDLRLGTQLLLLLAHAAGKPCGLHLRGKNIFGQIAAIVSKSPVRSKYIPASMTNKGVASTLP